MFTDEMFIDGHKKAYGEATAKKVLEKIKSTIPNIKTAKKVFLNEFGNEVHVNGPIAESLQKEESLQERIARFDRLSAQVAAIRLARFMSDPDHFDEFEDKDVNDDSLLDDVEIRDDFGDLVEKPVAEQKKPAADAAVQPTSAAAVSGDEPVAAVSKEASEVLSDD